MWDSFTPGLSMFPRLGNIKTMQPHAHPKGYDDVKTPKHKQLLSARSFRVILIGTSMMERLDSTGRNIFEDTGLGRVGILNAGVGGAWDMGKAEP